ncbi:MAG: ABC transporter permease [Firmicutes bacterium]|nr:ABC transporter permease [Bacillota bacterium]
MSKTSKEPLIHITKRKTMAWQKAWLIRLASIVAALIVAAVVTTAATGLDPASVFAKILEGAFGSERKIWILGKETAVLLCIAVAMAPAFRMKFWNLGGEGQVLIGAWMTAACMIYLGDKVPTPLLILISLIGAVAIGAVWAGIPAFFKAKWNTNETLFTLMMNYVAIQLVAYYIIIWESPKGSGKVGIINQATNAGWLPSIGSYQYLLNILIVACITVLMYIYLQYSKHGYEISVVGESQSTARYVGIKVDRVIIRTLLVSGGICGLCGFLMVAGTDHTITTTLAGGRGFLGVLVAWLAQFNALAMVLVSLLLCILSRGAGEISTAFGLNQSFGDILTGIILFFIIGSEFFINYRINFRGSDKAVKAAKSAGKEGGLH